MKKIALLLALTFVSQAVLAGQISKASFAFAVIGDGPYGENQEPAYDNLINDINSDKSVKFVIHVGDIKSGGERCDDELLIRRFNQYETFATPFIYTPGDNEWTDCHRLSNGSYLPTERLDFLRTLFFPVPGKTTGQRTISVTTQATFDGREKFVENTLFSKRGVVFSQNHVVGSNNNLNPWNQIDANDSMEDPRPDRIAEFEERNQASIEWLDYTFDYAIENNAKAVFLSFHANPRFDLNREEIGRAGFNDFIDRLLARAMEFDKPVVLAHGDFHVFVTDKPRLVPWYANADASSPEENQQSPNITRVQTFGDADNHWVKIEVIPEDKDVFRITPQIVKENL